MAPPPRQADTRSKPGSGSSARPDAAARSEPRRGSALGWLGLSMLFVTMASLLVATALLGFVFLQLKATDTAALKEEVSSLKTELAKFHGDVGKGMTDLQKEVDATKTQVNAATLELNDIALSLKKPNGTPQ